MQYRFSGLTPVSIVVVAALSAAPAVSANSLASARVQAQPTFETAAIRVITSGDDNTNAGGTVQFRIKGTSAWQAGHPLVRVAPGRLGSLLMNLREGTTYEVSVRLTDPDGAIAPVSASFITRATPRSVAGGPTLYVSPTGSAAPTGSLSAPFGRITDALRAAGPGATILVLPGTYRENVYNYFRSGTPDAPITIKAAGPGVYLRGDAANLAEPHTNRLWALQADGTYATQPAGMTSYVAVEGTRLYRYKTQTDLRAARAAGKTGWWRDATNRLYVVLSGNASPDRASMQVAQLGEGFRFTGVHDIILDGFDIGYFGNGFSQGIHLAASHNITIRNCDIHNVSYGVFMKDSSSNNVVENCTFWDKGLEAWTWGSIKGTDAEGGTVLVGMAGAGNVVRRNNIYGFFNGVAVVGSGEASAGADVYYNWLHDIGDDGIEPEGDVPDFRAWCNTVRNTQNSVSLAPINVGPAWVMYNTLTDFHEAGLKISNRTKGPVLAYHNTIVTSVPGVNALNPWTSMRNFTLRNNIIAATRYVIEDYYTTAASNATLENDLLYTTDATRFVKFGGARYSNIAQLQAAGRERGGLSGDPRFVGAGYGDFRLKPDSPARRRAAPIPGINDFLGFTPDIGALQMGP